MVSRFCGQSSAQAAVAFDAVPDYVVDQIVGDDHDHDHVHYHA